jgi:hypothetical protein
VSPYIKQISFVFKGLKYAIRRVQSNQGGLKLNGTHQLLVYADGANSLDENTYKAKYTKF